MNSAKRSLSNLGNRIRTSFSSDDENELETKSSMPYCSQMYEFSKEETINLEHLSNTKILQTKLPHNEIKPVQQSKMKINTYPHELSTSIVESTPLSHEGLGN